MPSLHPDAALRPECDKESLAALLGPIPSNSLDHAHGLHVIEALAPLGDFADGGAR